MQSKPLGKAPSADIMLSFVVMGIIGLIIIPLPEIILDLLIIVNLTLAINILLITLFTKNVLEFSTFPSILLIMTMFRLGILGNFENSSILLITTMFGLGLNLS